MEYFPARFQEPLKRHRDSRSLSPRFPEYGYSRLVPTNRSIDTEIPGLSLRASSSTDIPGSFPRTVQETRRFPVSLSEFSEYGHSRLISKNRSRDTEIPGLFPSLSRRIPWNTGTTP